LKACATPRRAGEEVKRARGTDPPGDVGQDRHQAALRPEVLDHRSVVAGRRVEAVCGFLRRPRRSVTLESEALGLGLEASREEEPIGEGCDDAATSGATMNSQTWLRASPPTMRAGPRLRAG